MLDIQGAIYSRLTGDAGLMSLLSTYKTLPAVFTSSFPPDFVHGERPALLIDRPSGAPTDDALDDRNRKPAVYVRAFCRPDVSNADLNTVIEGALARLRTWERELIDGALYQVESVAGPEDAPSADPTIEGALVQVRLYIQEA